MLYSHKIDTPNATPEYNDELLLGTDRIYVSKNSGAQWIDTVGHALSAGQPVVAAAFGLTTDQVIYAATKDGKVFATFNGNNAWTERDGGIPAGGTITSIVVDANNPQTAFVTDNFGGVGHVYKTLNGGASWTDISGTPSSGGLPSGPVYALIEDLRVQRGAPNGRVYVGTQTGVYVTLDDAGLDADGHRPHAHQSGEQPARRAGDEPGVQPGPGRAGRRHRRPRRLPDFPPTSSGRTWSRSTPNSRDDELARPTAWPAGR